jgi:hypothetical protein
MALAIQTSVVTAEAGAEETRHKGTEAAAAQHDVEDIQKD